ncbi:MAG: 6-pyruvoyl tetrahydropterin synthase [Acidobacteriota bacterium]|jgi:6-pyruvoyl-tetrahydropterin synthase
MKETSNKYKFEAAVQRPLNIVFRHPNGAWEGHDYLIEVVTGRQGLDSFDVVMDFRELETHLDALLDPFRGKLLSELGINDPIELAKHIADGLEKHIPPPAQIKEINLIDGHQQRLSYRVDRG